MASKRQKWIKRRIAHRLRYCPLNAAGIGVSSLLVLVTILAVASEGDWWLGGFGVLAIIANWLLYFLASPEYLAGIYWLPPFRYEWVDLDEEAFDEEIDGDSQLDKAK